MKKLSLAIIIVAGISLVTTSKEKESSDSSKAVVNAREFSVPAIQTMHKPVVAAWN